MVVSIHSANLHALDNPGVLKSMRPLVSISVGEKEKETEQGDWSKEESVWQFGETIMLEVSAQDEILISVTAVMRYDVFLATISTKTTSLGKLRLPVASVIQHLRWEDRDSDGMVYATPILGFDIVHEGRLNGRLHLSFQSKGPPPAVPQMTTASRCCGCGLDPKAVPPLAAAQLDSLELAGGAAPRVPSALNGSRDDLPDNWWEHYLDPSPRQDPFYGADTAFLTHRSQRSQAADGYIAGGAPAAGSPRCDSVGNGLPLKHWSFDIPLDTSQY